MTGKVTAENAFGQVLICLRMAKLNYMIKETPYSAYITIRKKFIKSVDGDMLEGENVEKVAPVDNLKQVESDNCYLKHRLKTLESECGVLRFEKEELEKKYKTLENEKDSLKDQFKEAFARNRELIKSNEQVDAESRNLQRTNENLTDDINETRNELKKAKKEIEEKCLESANRELYFEKSLEDKECEVLMFENVIQYSRDCGWPRRP